MASQKQIEANRRNAQKSTGPKTYAGKLQSRANALKHGMAALHCPLAHEETSNYHTMRAGLMETYEPANTQELMLVDNIASAWIQMQRAERFEASFMATFVEDIKYRCDKPNKGPWATDDTGIAILMAKDSLENAWITLDRYQRRANSAYYRAIEALRKTQAERRRKVLDEIRTEQEHQKYLKKTVADPNWQPDPTPGEEANSGVSPINATQMGSFGQNTLYSSHLASNIRNSAESFSKEGSSRAKTPGEKRSK